MCDAGAGMSWEMRGNYTIRGPHQFQPLLYTGRCSTAVLDPELFGNSIGGLGKDDRIGGESVTLIFSFNYVEIK